MIYSEPRQTLVMDEECYVNYWSIGFKCVETGRKRVFEKWNDSELDMKGIAKVCKTWRMVTFNGLGYDLPMLALAMSGATNGELKRASDTIILSDMKPWQFYEHYNVSLPDWIDHIDLMEVSPGSPTKPSLKIYMGRLHYKTMRDLPFQPDEIITPEKRQILLDYHDNDLGGTVAKYIELKPGIDLRAQMSDEYGVDLRSKSGPQVAEAVIKVEVERLTRKRLYRPDAKPHTFRYVAPDYITYETAQLQQLYQIVTTWPFVVNGKLQVEAPPALENYPIAMGESIYRVGIGGLHSSESGIAHLSDDLYELIDCDVASYYPSLILNSGYVPKHIGEVWKRVYKKIYDTRLAAKALATKLEDQLSRASESEAAIIKPQLKAAKDKAEALKLVLNGLFGKLGSAYSVVYAPNLMIQTTISGQLAILMLIERLEMAGFRVISANTDGFVTRVLRARRAEYNAIVFDWECDTALQTEKTFYKGLYSRDVNGFIAIDVKGKVKTKGPYAPAGPGLRGADGMKKNPNCEIAIDAVIAYLKDGTPLEQTIRACRDITKFVTIRTVKGGAIDQNGEYLGKAIRWAYGNDTGVLTYKLTGNAVPKSEGALPMMTLPTEFPDEINHDWYVREANAILQDIGMVASDPALAGRTGTMLARMGDQKTYHTVSLPGGRAWCGKMPASIREPWEEAKRVPDGMRMCASCRKGGDL